MGIHLRQNSMSSVPEYNHYGTLHPFLDIAQIVGKALAKHMA
jgi:hypothetical protein